MTPDQFKSLERRFKAYADAYIERSETPGPLQLKKKHTLRVCSEIDSLGREMGLDDEALQLARTMALFHDLGRFRQFEQYQTFLDMKSENHARLSLLEIKKEEILEGCSPRHAALIKGAISVHNAAELPCLNDDEKLFFMKLLRDADKLDIWRVVIGNYTDPDPESQQSVNLGLMDCGGCSPEAIAALVQQTYVRSGSIRELNDLKLMQISWIFDLNFPQSVIKVKERHYIEQIATALSIPFGSPDYVMVHQAIDGVYTYIDGVMDKVSEDGTPNQFRCHVC